MPADRMAKVTMSIRNCRIKKSWFLARIYSFLLALATDLKRFQVRL